MNDPLKVALNSYIERIAKLETLLQRASRHIQDWWRPEGSLPPAKSPDLVEDIDAALAIASQYQQCNGMPPPCKFDCPCHFEKVQQEVSERVPYGYVLKTGHGSKFCESLDGVHPEMRHLWRAVFLHSAQPVQQGKEAEPLELRLCEAQRLCLKPNQVYRFTVDPECPACRGAALLAAAP